MVAKHPVFCGGHRDCPGRYGTSLCHCGYAKDPAGRSVYGSDCVMEPLPEEPEPIYVTSDAEDAAARELVGNAGCCDNGRDIPLATAKDAAAHATITVQGAATIRPARAVTSRHQTRWGPPRPRQVTQNARRAGKNSIKKSNCAWLETGMPRLSQQAQAWSGLFAHSSPLVKRHEGAKNLVAMLQKALSTLKLVVKTDARTITSVMGEQRA